MSGFLFVIPGLMISGFGLVNQIIPIMMMGLLITIFPFFMSVWFSYGFTGGEKDARYYSMMTSSFATVFILPFLLIRKK